MKKIKMLFVALIGLLSLGFVIEPVAAEAVDEEPITEEVVEEETETTEETEPIVDEEPVFEMPDMNYDNLYETWTAIVSWAGGVTGLMAMVMYGIRAFREKKILRETKDAINEIKESDNNKSQKLDQLYQTIGEYNKREEVLEKAIINLIGLSGVDPKVRKEIIESIEKPEVSLGDLLTNKLELIKQEIKENEDIEADVAAQTKSLLSKLAEEDKE